jgi:hypothetical protein
MESVPAARRRFFPEVSGILAKGNEPIFCFRLQRKAKRDFYLHQILYKKEKERNFI